MQRFPLWTDAVLSVAVSCGSAPPSQLWRSDWVRHKYDSVRMYWVPHFGGACYSPNVLLRCGGGGGGEGGLARAVAVGIRWQAPPGQRLLSSWTVYTTSSSACPAPCAAESVLGDHGHRPASQRPPPPEAPPSLPRPPCLPPPHPTTNLCSGGVTFTASFTLPDGTPLGGDIAPWTGANAPTVHLMGHTMPEHQAAAAAGLCSKHAVHM